ncbi:MAG TPA: glycosyltransferase family 4 protein [Thermoleophilaceae bacterium]
MDSKRAVVICPVLPYPEVGGGHKRTMRLLEAIESAGVTPHLVTTDRRDASAEAALRSRGWGLTIVAEAPGTITRRAGQHMRRLPSPYLEAVATCVAELVAEGCAFVQVEHTQSAYYRRAIGSTPWVLSLHNVDSHLMRSLVRSQPPSRMWLGSVNRWLALRSVERRAVPAANAVLCVSEDDRRALAQLSENVIVVPNGVDDAFFGVPAELPTEETVLFFGQFDYPPNALGIQRFLRDGWPIVSSSRPKATLRLVGGGMTRGLRELATRVGGVEVVGFVPNLAAELAASRIALVPLWAGGGTRLKVVESLAAARPVVGTSLGVEGIGFQAGIHGEIGEDPAELARLTVALLGDSARASRLAEAGRQLAEAFRWQRATRPAERLYRELAAR